MTVGASQSSPESESESKPPPLMVFFSTFVNFVPDFCVPVGGSARLPLEQAKTRRMILKSGLIHILFFIVKR